MAAKQATATFTKERETKGTFVFAEEGDDDKHVVGKLYIKKPAMERLGWDNPTKVKLTVTVA